MRMSKLRCAVLAVLLVLIGGLAYVLGVGNERVTARSQVEIVPAPTSWVPFQADLLLKEEGKKDIVGKYYRGANGSFRQETGPADGSIVIVGINNFERNLVYGTTPDGRWYSVPMPTRVSVPMMRADARGFVKLSEKREGFEVYKATHPSDGRTRLEAPALNFFALVEDSPPRRLEHRNIRLGEQPAALFEPPPGVNVRHFAKPSDVTREAMQ